MIDDYLTQTGYHVDRSIVKLYDAVPSSSPITLTGTAPTQAYRCRVKVASVTGHTDCTGSITVGSNAALSFTASGQSKNTTVNITASTLPIVTYSDLDCQITIECLDVGGQPIYSETQTAIYCRFNNSQKAFQDSTGAWSSTDAIAYINDSSLGLGDVFSYGGYDYDVAKMSSHTDLDGEEQFRKLYLTGMRAAPTGRTTTITAASPVIDEYMLKSEYDANDDGVADEAESLSDGAIVDGGEIT